MACCRYSIAISQDVASHSRTRRVPQFRQAGLQPIAGVQVRLGSRVWSGLRYLESHQVVELPQKPRRSPLRRGHPRRKPAILLEADDVPTLRRDGESGVPDGRTADRREAASSPFGLVSFLLGGAEGLELLPRLVGEVPAQRWRRDTKVSTSNGDRQAELTVRVKRCIIDAIGVKVAPSTIPDDMPLLDKGLGLDSVAILRLVAALEDEFDVEIEDKVIRPELFRSVGTLSQYMATRTADGAPGV